MLVPDGANSETCDDIAEQLIRNNPGNKFKVILGGGRGYFTPTSVNDSETGLGGRRLDGVNLIDEWKNANPNGAYVESQQQLVNLDVNQVDKVLGKSTSTGID
jgi:alkaline phosphatase